MQIPISPTELMEMFRELAPQTQRPGDSRGAAEPLYARNESAAIVQEAKQDVNRTRDND